MGFIQGAIGFILLVLPLAAASISENIIENGVDQSNLNVSPLNAVFRPDDSFAACLLVMDDNHRIIEWLAYHYHTLPLRRLILMVDPRSKTSPRPVLERWSSYMKIDLWTDGDVFSEEDLKDRTSDEGMVRLHRKRQRLFNVKCMHALRDEGARWTLMTDVDEYLYINPRAWDPSDSLYQLDMNPISIYYPGMILKMLDKIDLADPRFHAQQWQACLPVHRLQLGGVESPTDVVEKLFPKELEPSMFANDFDTFRWRYHGVDDITARNGVIPGKTIVNVNSVPKEELWRFIGDPHRPIDKLCNGQNVWLHANETIFIANHVLGTMQQYAARDDARFVNRVLTWERRKAIGGSLTDELRPWLAGFVKDVGLKESRRLLANVGQLQTRTFELPRCSLNFFGLPRSFKAIALPSIVKNILLPNADYNCDIFVHFYKLDHEAVGRFNKGGNLDPASVYALESIAGVIAAHAGKNAPAIAFTDETPEQFSANYGDLVHHYQTAKDPETGKLVYFPWKDASYTSLKQIENVVMQWNSIQSVWNMMGNHANKLGIEYKRVAYFRLDAFYALPVDIFQLDKDTYDYNNRYAVMPGFARYPVNDRMFYGPVEAVKIWATQRFELLEDYIARNVTGTYGYGMHSERYLANGVLPAIANKTGYEVIENHDICFYRTRAEDTLLINDCSDVKGGVTRGILGMNQTQLVEDLVNRDCREFPFDESGRFIGLSCSDSIQSKVTNVSRRNLQASEAPKAAPKKAKIKAPKKAKSATDQESKQAKKSRSRK